MNLAEPGHWPCNGSPADGPKAGSPDPGRRGNPFDELLASFSIASLRMMENARLMDRLETKFTFRREQLPCLLESLVPHYCLFAPDGVLAQRYATHYFDTPELSLYARHHNRHYPRHKVRYRRYLDSDRCFFEIKVKNCRGRTLKLRVEKAAVSDVIDDEAAQLLREVSPYSPDDFRPILRVDYRRLTLVAIHSQERVTLDLNLSCQDGHRQVGFPNLVVAEVKRDRSEFPSPFIAVARGRHIRRISLSKYCLGVVTLKPGVRMNRFRQTVRRLMALAT